MLGSPLSESAVRALLVYVEELCAWNQRINLTAIRDPDDIVTYHFLDSLSALSAFEPEPHSTLADLGTGAGFPGAVLQIARPELRVTLIEAGKKKAAFLHHLRGRLHLSRLAIVEDRIEAVRASFDRLISRAISPSRVLAMAPPLLKIGGELILFSKRPGGLPLPERDSSWSIRRTVSVTLPFTQESRSIIVLVPRPPIARNAKT